MPPPAGTSTEKVHATLPVVLRPVTQSEETAEGVPGKTKVCPAD